MGILKDMIEAGADAIGEAVDWADDNIRQPVIEWYEENASQEVKDTVNAVNDFGEGFFRQGEDILEAQTQTAIETMVSLVQATSVGEAFSILLGTNDRYQENLSEVTTTPLTEVEAESTILDNVENAQVVVDALMALDTAEAKEASSEVRTAAETALSNINSASDADLSEALILGLVDVMRAGADTLQPVLEQVLGKYGYQVLADAGWDLAKVDVPGMLANLATTMIAGKLTDTTKENVNLSAMLSILKYAMGQDVEWATTLRGAQIASDAVKGALPGIVGALSDMLGVPISSSWTTEAINGSPYYVLGLGPYKVAVAAVPVEGFDVRVFKVKYSDSKVLNSALNLTPKSIRKTAAMAIDWAFNPEVHEATEEMIRTQPTWVQALPSIRNFLRVVSSFRTPVEDEPLPEEEEEELPDDETEEVEEHPRAITQDSFTPPQRRGRQLEEEGDALTAYHRGQARRATISQGKGR